MEVSEVEHGTFDFLLEILDSAWIWQTKICAPLREAVVDIIEWGDGRKEGDICSGRYRGRVWVDEDSLLWRVRLCCHDLATVCDRESQPWPRTLSSVAIFVGTPNIAKVRPRDRPTAEHTSHSRRQLGHRTRTLV